MKKKADHKASHKKHPSKKVFTNLKNALLEFMKGKNYQPHDRKGLYKKLAIPEELERVLDQVIDQLLEKKIITKGPAGYIFGDQKNPVLSGILSLHPKGFGFVKPENAVANQPDIFIPKHLVNGAVDGDLVQVEQEADVSIKGPEGRILSILERKRSELTGVISAKVGKQYIAIAKQLGPTKQILVHSTKKYSIKVGDRVLMKVLHWEDRHDKTECEIIERLGHIDDPSIDTKIAIKEFEIRSAFDKAVLAEVQARDSDVTEEDKKGRKDFTNLECVTIDPTTAKDFDDAISLTKDQKGNYHLGVHIADVSYYIEPGSALDKEAYRRCNSTYFPNQCVPMLPEKLSNGICSLKPNVDRLVVSVMISFDPDGELNSYSIHRGVIHSQKRFTYEEAYDVLEGKAESKHLPLLNRMKELCLLLKAKKKERGSIDFSLPDIVVKVNKAGEPEGVDIVEYDITHQMIEEFMLKANEI